MPQETRPNRSIARSRGSRAARISATAATSSLKFRYAYGRSSPGFLGIGNRRMGLQRYPRRM
ncbi:MAG: hypothetical protein A3I06_15280 [Candidatus Lindowbacteria bacterium RIFCSPLOWO2_02_FULL_62_12]|nr:MAG: hypothetical protein A3I06_15280 [Candidatus Lindowbacteria bacterium RIFCSPLOWO2_02_FULL_62_12]